MPLPDWVEKHKKKGFEIKKINWPLLYLRAQSQGGTRRKKKLLM